MFMIGYTAYAVTLSDVKRNTNGTPVEFYYTIGNDGFVTSYAIIITL